MAQEAEQQEALHQSQSRQRDQQWQAKLDAVRVDAQTQVEQALRRQETEADARLRDLETQLRKELQQREDTARAEARKREQELVADLTAQAEARYQAAQDQWEQEAEQKLHAVVTPFRSQLARTEQEREEARQSAAAAFSQVQDMEKKLSEASSFLNGWKNGKHLAMTGR
jgi:hypothetical protein